MTRASVAPWFAIASPLVGVAADEAGYEECDVHDLDTGDHWALVPSYRAVKTIPTTTDAPEVQP